MSTVNAKYQWPVGTTFLFTIPPGLIIGGTVAEVYEDVIVLKNTVYFESLKQGASFGDYAMSKNATELGKVSNTNWPLPDGYVVRKDCVTHAVPCAMSFERQAKAKLVAAIKGA